MREAIGWTAFYLALPVAFFGILWAGFGSDPRHRIPHGLHRGEVAVGRQPVRLHALARRVRGAARVAAARAAVRRDRRAGAARRLHRARARSAGALRLDVPVLWRGAAATASRCCATRSGEPSTRSISRELRSVRVIRRFWPVTDEYRGTRISVRENGRRALTPLLLVIAAVMATDVVFAVDSVPAVYGITGDPYLVFVTNAFALLGLRALYFVLRARCRAWSTWATAWPRSSRSSASSWYCTGRTASGPDAGGPDARVACRDRGGARRGHRDEPEGHARADDDSATADSAAQ